MAELPAPSGPQVIMETSEGTVVLDLFEKHAPTTVENFLHYVKTGYYDGLIFHRVIKGFVIQGGGFTQDGRQKQPTRSPIKLEIGPGLFHADGALSMARTSDPNSATCQFYVCHGKQSSLDRNYAVFGKVSSGLDVVDKIAKKPTDRDDKPRAPVTIKKMSIKA
ncbi:MAG: peptidylprolyl isomerase [Thermoplasmatota archaeon]